MQPLETHANATTTVLRGTTNTVLQAESGGSIHYESNVVYQQLNKPHAPAVAQGQFFALKLEDYGSQRWVNPPQASEIVQLLAEHHLLILAGDLDEKQDCAYHLAHRLREKWKVKGAGEIQVLEKCPGRDPQKIETALDEEEPKILILPDVSPRQIVGQTPVALRSLLRAHRSFAILTTDNNPEDWGIAPGSLESQLWRELSWESYYGVPLLRDFFLNQLRGSNKAVPEPLLPDNDGAFLVEKLRVDTVVSRLRTPNKVRLFCDWLLAFKGRLDKEQIEEQLASLQGDVQGVSRWYRQFDARHQLLILGLTLFDGLPDEMLFTGLELLVDSIWRSSDPAIPQFDYGDLVHCSAYFKKVETEEGLTRVRSTGQEQRYGILQLAWNHQRRRLLNALPVLREMIRLSAASVERTNFDAARTPASGTPPPDPTAARRGAERALNRSENDTLQLHQVLVDSLGLISRLSTHEVEPHFLDLASDPSESVQLLVARALSTWREDGHEKELIALIHSWWRQACETWDLGSRIARLGQRGEDPFAAIRAAVALIVGNAARFDRENQLTAPFYDLLVRVLEDRNPRVKTAAARALELSIAWHFRQLEPLLRMRVLYTDDFLLAIARGVAEACSLRTEETVAILDNWRALARAEKRTSSPGRVTPRERLLATVALAYGEVRPDRGEWPLGPEILCANLRSILMEEFHPFVRHYAFAAIEKQALQNFDLVVQLLQDLLSQIQLQDRPAVVEIFVKTYLHQRQRLDGGDGKIEINGVNYYVWMESPRPLTEIEATLYGWLLDSSHPIVQQLAVDIFDRLGKTNLEAAERRMRATRPIVPRSETAALSADRRPQPQVHPLPVLGHLAVFCAAPRKPPVRATLQPLLAEVIALQKVRPPQPASRPATHPALEVFKPPIVALLERWGGVPNEATKAVAGLLGRAFFFYRWRWLFIGLALLLALVLYEGVPYAYHRFQEYRAVASVQKTSAGNPSRQPASTGPSIH